MCLTQPFSLLGELCSSELGICRSSSALQGEARAGTALPVSGHTCHFPSIIGCLHALEFKPASPKSAFLVIKRMSQPLILNLFRTQVGVREGSFPVSVNPATCPRLCLPLCGSVTGKLDQHTLYFLTFFSKLFSSDHRSPKQPSSSQG